jgi:hypothetical protein
MGWVRGPLVVVRPGDPFRRRDGQAGAVGGQPTNPAVVSTCGQVGYGMQRSRASAMVNEWATASRRAGAASAGGRSE